MAVQIQKGGKILIALIGLALIVFVIYKYGLSDKETAKTEPARDVKTTETSNTDVKTAYTPRTDVLSKARQSNVIRVGMEAEAPPMNYLTADKKREGFDVEFANAIASKLGIGRVDVIEEKYDKLPNLLRNGNIDLMMGGYVPDPAIDKVDWSEGYLEFGLCLIVKQGSAIRELKHLAGKTIGIYDDPAAQSWVKENVKDAKAIKTFDKTGWFASLDRGEVDAIIYDYPFAVREIKSFPKLRIVKLNLNTSKYAIGIPSQNDDLLSAVNNAVIDITKSEDFEKMVKKYLSTEAVQLEELPKGSKTYAVKAGDTLSKIAQKQLGNKDDWKKIWDLNKNRLANPHLLSVGMQLLMP